MNISGIYQIQSRIKPERIYIGSSKSIYFRWETHLRTLAKNKHHSIKLQRHYDKYGKEDLVFSILLGCPKEENRISKVRQKTFFGNKIKNE